MPDVAALAAAFLARPVVATWRSDYRRFWQLELAPELREPVWAEMIRQAGERLAIKRAENQRRAAQQAELISRRRCR